jgi:hypothetical protein
MDGMECEERNVGGGLQVKVECLRVGLGVGEEVHKVENAAVSLAEERQLELLLRRDQ